jgi:uncharacterized protein
VAKTVVVTGATGMVGQPLVKRLVERGDRVIALARDEKRCARKLGDKVTCVEADLETAGAWRERLAGVDAIVHLAGEPIAAKRWDTQQKQKIRDSRVESTRMIVEGLATLSDAQRPKVLVAASGADYYGFANRDLDDDDPVDERAPAGDSFLSRVCLAWENEAAAAERLGVRVVRMRCGIVIGPGEALDKMTKPFKLFAGGRIGSGEQWFSWISLADAVAAYLAAVDDERYAGAVNLVAPESTRNRDLARALGKVLHRPSWMPVPGFALRAAVGSELAEYILEGRRVVPTALEKNAFPFAYPSLAGALEAAISARSS